MAATNRAALLDPALMRAGRFDRKISIPRPDAAARLEILQVHARRHRLAPAVDLAQLAQDVPGLVGADLANLLNEAALAAVRDGAEEISDAHVQVRRPSPQPSCLRRRAGACRHPCAGRHPIPGVRCGHVRATSGAAGVTGDGVGCEAVYALVSRWGCVAWACMWSMRGAVQAATDRVLMGDTKPAFNTDTPLGAKISRALAVHEAGRAVLAVQLRRETGLVDDVEKLSMVRRGQSYTRVAFARGLDDNYLLVTRKQLRVQLRLAVAGHASEELLGLDVSTYSADDFARAGVRASLLPSLGVAWV